MVIVIDGKKLAAGKEKELAKKVVEFKAAVGFPPKLAAIMVGDDPASKLYLKVKEKAAERAGVEFEKKEFSASTNPRAIMDFIKAANKDSSVHGIMVQLPLPKKFSILNSQFSILATISPSKDVDCLTPENLGLLVMGRPYFLPATVKAVMEILTWVLEPPAENFGSTSDSLAKKRVLLNRGIGARKVKSHKIWQAAQALQGTNVVIVGAGNLVGKPLAVHLKNLGATVTICDEYTRSLKDFTKMAKVLISATGVPGLIKKEMVKKGAVVIDVGSPRGDVDFEKVQQVASAITPIPGGVGPLTVVALLKNTLIAAKRQFGEIKL